LLFLLGERKAHLAPGDHRTPIDRKESPFMLDLIDFFCGAGGSAQGAHAVPGVKVRLAANHWELAVNSHAANFPSTEHLVADIAQVDMRRLPAGDLLWASPECTNHSIARGRSKAADSQPDLFGETLPDEAAERSRATMWDVPRYLEELINRGRPASGFVVENVVDARDWVMWRAWLLALDSLGYGYRVVFLNSMFVQSQVTPWAPQSRDRLYVVGWRKTLGRTPDFAKWLRPRAYCETCESWVDAVQAWKDPDKQFGRYGAKRQYVYRCPSTTCRNAMVHPPVVPAAAAIDWSLPATRIGDRARPLADKTLKRIAAGLAKQYRYPLLTPAGGTWNDTAYPVSEVMRTRTTRDSEGITIPPLLIPMEGREGKGAWPVTGVLRTQTTRNETGLAIVPGQRAPFMVEMRGGGHRAVFEPMATVCANGNHHGLAVPPGLGAMLIPYYRTGVAHPVTRPMGTVTTHDRNGLATYAADEVEVEDCEFRMLEPEEVGAGMAFEEDYKVLGNKRERVRQYGNAVTPPASENLVSAVAEAITGEDLPRHTLAA
jgi:DNA (cytosine-5)-methyltransferase 1